ncbi:AAA family ATPase [Nocardia sp. NPDC058666]|uniref:nucleotide-binding protein n=1 Tax=unclassified Nocardia TaxID=2637762 RepID=UPI00364B31CB
MSRNNDSLPMLPPWLSESDVTQVGYEAPVENLPQDDEIDEAPKRRRFLGRGEDAPRKEKGGRRRRKDREPEEEAAQQQSAHPADPARRTEQPVSDWSTQPPNAPIPGPSHQQPSPELPPRQPAHPDALRDPSPHQPTRDYAPQSPSPSREQQPLRSSTGEQGPFPQTPSREQQPLRPTGEHGTFPQPPNREQPLRPTTGDHAAVLQPPTHEQQPHRAVAGEQSTFQPWTQSTDEQAANQRPLAQQPPREQLADQQASREQTPVQQSPLSQPTREQAARPQQAPQQASTGWQTAPGPQMPPTSETRTPAQSDAGVRPTGHGPSVNDPAPWPSAQPAPTAPADASASPSHAGPALPATPGEAAKTDTNGLPARTPAPPSNGFTPLGPTQQRPDLPPPPRPDLPPPPPLPAPPSEPSPARPTQAPPRLTVPAESQPVAPRPDAERPTAEPQTAAQPTDAVSQAAPARLTSEPHTASQAAPTRLTAEPDAPESASPTTASTESRPTGARHSAGGWSMPAEGAPAETAPTTAGSARPNAATTEAQADSIAGSTQSPTAAASTSESQPQPDFSTPEASSNAGRSAAPSPHATGESALRNESPYRTGEFVDPQLPAEVDPRSPYASGESALPSTYPATQYNPVPGDPAPTHAPEDRTEVFRSDDSRVQGAPHRATEQSASSWQGGAGSAQGGQTGYRSGEFVQAADAASPYPRPDGTPAQHQQPDGLPTYGPDGVAQRPDGAAPQYQPAPAQQPDGSPQYRPDGAYQQPAEYVQPNQVAPQQFPANAPAQQYQPDGSPAPQYQQPNGPGQQFAPNGTPAQPNGPGQFLPDGTPAPQHQPNGPGQFQPNSPAPQQYQPPQQYQQPPNQQRPQYGQPGWGAQPQGYQPSLDDVPVKRAKKAPGSGWRKAVHHASGGAINPGMSAEELRLQELVARIRQPVRGDYRIAVLSLKGGVGKTTTTTGIGSIFASIRGDRVIAVDANPDFGTLSQRVAIQTRSTVRDLLLDPSIERYSDVRRHTSQGSSRLEVLASERDPAASEAFNDEEYRAVARILQRFYNIILTDCGTGLMHSAMSGVLDLAHSLVLISSAAIDGARSAAATLDWLSLHGHDHLVRNAVVVINLPREGSPNVGIQQLREYFLSRCRAVHIIPFDEHLSEGAEIDLHRLHKTTKRAYVELAATVADEFGVDHRRFN